MIETWANEAVRNGEYCEHWGLTYTQNEGTLASGYTEMCEYPMLPGADSMAIASSTVLAWASGTTWTPGARSWASPFCTA